MAAPTPLPSPGRRRAVTLLAALPWPAVLFQFLVILPRYDKLFRDNRVRVGDLTAVLLNVSAWTRLYVTVAYLFVFGLMGISMFAANTVHSRAMSPGRRGAILLVVFGLPAAIFALGVIGTQRTLAEGFPK